MLLTASSTEDAKVLDVSRSVPTGSTTPMVTAPSLKGGMPSFPANAYMPPAITSVAATPAIITLGFAMLHRIPGVIRRLIQPTNRVSPSCLPLFFALPRRYVQRAGVRVSDTASEARSETRYAPPRGASSLPSTPGMKKIGKKTMATRIVAYTIELRTSLEARNTTSANDSCMPFVRHSLNRCVTFSTSTMASSTSSPIATAIPPSVITLTDRSNDLKTIAVTRMLIGIAVRVIAVMRIFAKKSMRMITTRIVPSRNASTTLLRPA